MGYNTSESEQSPTGHNHSSTSSAHDFAVFANVNIQGNSASSSFSQSQVTLNTMSTSITDFGDTASLHSAMLPPELPKRSNSITSLPNNINCTDTKPILSPRNTDHVVTTALRSQPIISPKLLDSVNEERTPPPASAGFATNNNNNGDPPLISPRTDKPNSYPAQQHTGADGAGTSTFNRSPFQNTSHQRTASSSSTAVRSSIYGCISVFDDGASASSSSATISPKHSNATSDIQQEFGPLPISPHVNVPNAHSFCHIPPPPLPPRKREKPESEAVRIAQAQNRQAADAPALPPRDVSPPPVPPRLSLTHIAIKKLNACNIYNEDGLREHSLKLPNTSTIMMRRNSQLREGGASTSDGSGATTPLPATKSLDLDFPNVNSANKFHANATSAPPINRKAK